MDAKKTKFVAINEIKTDMDYAPRMEALFQSRQHLVDQRTGFLGMTVLKPTSVQKNYLVISEWESENHFEQWSQDSEEFQKGHARALADLKTYQSQGKAPPMVSTVSKYHVLCN